ncbi:MAG: nicotinic acid mononucleotide adenyltransferase [Nonlabens sp.]|uniref:nicotinic acid mononucleotide adenyltransferase n=1 Tax=Nonlabens sp. TaxID=1888209 RepID=UPI003EF49470
MKTFYKIMGSLLIAMTIVSCETEVVLGDGFDNRPTLNEILSDQDVWYVDLNSTLGNPDIPFMTRAFTISFDFGTLYANNNLVGVGRAGAGLGLDVGSYQIVNNQVSILHDIDGLHDFQVVVLSYNRIKIIDLHRGTVYYLDGYNRSNFDYDQLFYDNIQYFLQEYKAWEKVYTSNVGALNDFDDENYLQFTPGFNGDEFKSSTDRTGLNYSSLFWDYTGEYWVEDATPGSINKHLTMDYDFLGNDYFDLYVIDDRTIELYHAASGTTYEFKGRGYIQLKSTNSVESNTGKSRMIDAGRIINKKK